MMKKNMTTKRTRTASPCAIRASHDVEIAFLSAGHDVEDERACHDIGNCAQNRFFVFFNT